MLKLLKYTAHRTNNEEMPATRSCGFFQVPYRSIFVGQIRLNLYRIRLILHNLSGNVMDI